MGRIARAKWRPPRSRRPWRGRSSPAAPPLAHPRRSRQPYGVGAPHGRSAGDQWASGAGDTRWAVEAIAVSLGTLGRTTRLAAEVLAAEVLVLGHELAGDERRALWVVDDRQ